MTERNKKAVIAIVGGFFTIVGVVTFLVALYGFFTGTNPVCN